MVDPVSAAIAATKAYAGVRAFIEAGKSIEDTFTVIARWQGHVSDVVYASQKEQKKNPFRKIMFSKSAEAEAAQIFAARKKVESQRRELVMLLNMYYGKEGLLEYRQIVKEVAEQRKKDVYEAAEAREFIMQMLLLFAMLTVLGGLLVLIVSKILS